MMVGPDKVDLKVVLLGREYSGKTALAHRYLLQKFNPHMNYQTTVGAAYGARKFEVDKQTIFMGLWDTAGSERYECMSHVYYHGAWAALVCFELIDRESWLRARHWANEVMTRGDEGCKIYLIGTKADLVTEPGTPRKIEYATAKSYADDIRAKYIETSSKTGQNVEEMYCMIAEDYVADMAKKTKGEN
ncbi:hypothetical protein CAPTEDRAFT_179082 [Capitella teleta]|uniref:Uncharacterized protein n=1 Tax=Capitella teleta TaxID=283909 RepID=R7TKU0_CAPTE|nr:hypothetical protein CAPTEDRAFT_179082 [Capitella teleta]|eukprot:ELT94294.1 hypothetical protein CAPTEDRAFT_179082 [Capitella teleta]